MHYNRGAQHNRRGVPGRSDESQLYLSIHDFLWRSLPIFPINLFTFSHVLLLVHRKTFVFGTGFSIFGL